MTVSKEFTPPTPKGRERLDSFLTVSTDLFLELGYDSVTLDDVIAKSGGSRATLYRAFGGKQQLFEAVVQDFCAKFSAELCQISYANLDFSTGFYKLARGYVTLALSERQVSFYRIVMGTAGRFPSVGALWYHQGVNAVSQVFYDFLRSHISVTDASDEAVKMLADNVQGSLVFCLLNQAAVLQKPSDTEVSATIDAVAALASRAFAELTE